MLGHIVNAGVRALAASIVLGGILMFAAGGVGSADARAIAAVTVIGFFIFWIVFTFMFGRRLPKAKARGRDHEWEGTGFHAPRGRRREEDETAHQSETAEGHGDASD